MDTSALAKLILREPGSNQAAELWRAAAAAVSSRVLYVEARSALAAARRASRVTSSAGARARARLEDLVRRLDLVELHPGLARLAGDVAERHRLCAHDAVHLASALVLSDSDLLLMTWDRDLRRAAGEAGLAVAPA
ncbi:MAG: type II toxin-antitoxin system VapC family toxin [Actinomycetota bacterium]|nr:type II toxin-antitoxin system VapC family toxin [Actinomycetota bacterium]